MQQPGAIHGRFYYFIENYLRLEYILYVFWAIFWMLNGLDKFFNGRMVQTPNGPRELGWFGVTRDQKFLDYFGKLYLPKWTAMSFLYTFAGVGNYRWPDLPVDPFLARDAEGLSPSGLQNEHADLPGLFYRRHSFW